MDLLSDIRKKASERGKHIVLPEGSDERMIKAAERLHRERICKVTLLDPEKNVIEKAKELGVCLDGIEVLNAQDSNKVDKYDIETDLSGKRTHIFWETNNNDLYYMCCNDSGLVDISSKQIFSGDRYEPSVESELEFNDIRAVSYTHLTLPTN